MNNLHLPARFLDLFSFTALFPLIDIYLTYQQGGLCAVGNIFQHTVYILQDLQCRVCSSLHDLAFRFAIPSLILVNSKCSFLKGYGGPPPCVLWNFQLHIEVFLKKEEKKKRNIVVYGQNTDKIQDAGCTCPLGFFFHQSLTLNPHFFNLKCGLIRLVIVCLTLLLTLLPVVIW